ncbi:3'-5' exonuclease [uncultured Jannaschia sp.]|uniref:3'-5' exonuclease n=1 Tax=uncultured Jannaschia sp. TaxID=293347 RepID=UPI002622EA75|nr:3'-5' exonuclease [uncultured Jannaschia sp.]
MRTVIADTFLKSLAGLTGDEQKRGKLTAFELQANPDHPGLQFHRISKSRDPDFWSVRVSRDLRIIVHKTGGSLMIAFIGHHDDAYDWAERRRVDVHPRTRAAQIVEVRELVENRPVDPIGAGNLFELPTPPPPGPACLKGLEPNDLAGIGVPSDWVEDLLAADEDKLLALADHIPQEAAEALLAYAVDGTPLAPSTPPVPDLDPFLQPDAQRRFRVIPSGSKADAEEFARALDAPWERWILYLHPSQRRVVERRFDGPARVAGSAGTGKTVVALHRAAAALRADPSTKVLLTTFSRPLAQMLETKLRLLLDDPAAMDRATVASLRDAASELYALETGRTPRIASEKDVDAAVRDACESSEFSYRFVRAEWAKVVDAWQLDALEDYTRVPRLGRRSRLGAKQRTRLWPIFVAIRNQLERLGLTTWPKVFADVTAIDRRPYSHIVVDEAQDLGVPELRWLATLTKDHPDALFFAGDLGQRIFQEPFSWAGLGVDIRGRSVTLNVNYRTSHQIRGVADRLLPPSIRDVDGEEETRAGTVSVFNGPVPDIRVVGTIQEEEMQVGAWIGALVSKGVRHEEIGVFVRSEALLDRAKALLRDHPKILASTMHSAKGLEFRAVAVIACDDEWLPLASRVDEVQDETELEEVFETERHLLYVACTRAREHLLITGTEPPSEYLTDLVPR